MALLILVVGLGLNFSAFAAPPQEVDNQAYWLCKHKKDVRTIRVHIDDGGVCATLYSRDGVEKLVGSGKMHESCLNFLNNIKTNLEKSNWTCRDITDTKITASLE